MLFDKNTLKHKAIATIYCLENILNEFYEPFLGTKNDKQNLLNGHLTKFNWF